MNSRIDSRAVAIQPQREAGVRRYNTVLFAADELIKEEGLNGFSIPLLAEKLGYTRRSIYKFFPTPYAILNELTCQYLDRLEIRLKEIATILVSLNWEAMIEEMVRGAAEFHNLNPGSRILILGGAVTDESFRATEFSVRKLGGLLRTMLEGREIYLPEQPDVASLAVDIGTTVFRVSNLYNREIRDDYIEEAVHAMTAYLSKYID